MNNFAIFREIDVISHTFLPPLAFQIDIGFKIRITNERETLRKHRNSSHLSNARLKMMALEKKLSRLIHCHWGEPSTFPPKITRKRLGRLNIDLV